MKKVITTNIFSTFFLSILIISCSGLKVNNLGYSTYKGIINNPNVPVEDITNNYWMKTDGTIVNYKKMTGGKIGLLTKNFVEFDNVKYSVRESVLGYSLDGVFYHRLGDDYIKRVIHGKKINVYMDERDVNKDGLGSRFYWVQRGEMGAMERIGSYDDIKQVVNDCPLAFEMMNKSESAIKKEIQKTNYLNKVFRIYNNACKTVD